MQNKNKIKTKEKHRDKWPLMSFCCTHRSVTCSAIIWEDQQMKNIQTHSQTLGKEWGTLEDLALNRCFQQALPSGVREPPGKGDSKSVWDRRDGEYKENKVFWIDMIKPHINSWRRKQQAQGLRWPGSRPLRMYYGFSFRVVMGFLSMWMIESLTLVPSLGLFSFCLFVLLNSNEIHLFHLTIFYFVTLLLLFLKNLFFSNERQKRAWEKRWGGRGRSKSHN